MCPSTGSIGTLDELTALYPEHPRDYFVPVKTLTKQQDLSSQVQPYEPCPCGSGNKFKFCCHAKAQEAKNIRQLARDACAFLLMACVTSGFTGCAQLTGLESDVIADATTDVASGKALQQDYYTAANAVNQSLNGQPLDAATVLKAAQAAVTSANGSGVGIAVDNLVANVNSQIKQLSADGASVAAIVKSGSALTAAVEQAVAAVPAKS